MKYSKTEEYWRVRARLAEDFIEKHPADPDMKAEQKSAYVKWLNHKEKDPKEWDALFEKVDDTQVHIAHGKAIQCDFVLIPKHCLKTTN